MTQEPIEIHGIPHALGFPSGSSSSYSNLDFDWDYDIGGIRLLSFASDEYPYQRQLTKVTKEQLDTSTLPGDNSLQGWWTRSQTDWSGGSGQQYMEPATDSLVQRKFYSSAGVDVFTRPGFTSLLPEAVELDRRTGTTGQLAKLYEGFVYSIGSSAYISLGTEDTVTVTTSDPIAGITVAADKIVLAHDGSCTVAPSSGLGATTGITGFTGVPVLAWLKNRLILMAEDKIFEIPAGDLTADIDLTGATPKVNMDDSSWSFVGATSTPQSILVAGNGAAGSSILALTLDNTGELPDLTSPIEVAAFPVSEQLAGIASYLGTFVGILTDKGIRVGTVSDTGGLVYGPLIGAPPSTGDAGDISVYDRFMFYPVVDAGDGRGGMIAVDLSTSDEDGRNSWSNWTRIPTQYPVFDAIVLGERITVMLALEGEEVVLYECDDTVLESSGWLHSSWVRFNTLESKTFESVKIVCDPTVTGFIDVEYIDDRDVSVRIGSLVGPAQEDSFKLNARQGFTDCAFRFQLTRDETDSTQGPVLAAWSTRAWPAVQGRGETVVLPFLLFDFERDTTGLKVGFEGYAKDRWNALIERITDGRTVTVIENKSGFSYEAIAEDATVTQVAPPSNASGFGGVGQIILRTT